MELSTERIAAIKTLLAAAKAITEDVKFGVCRPLLMDGEGTYFAKNGNRIMPTDVLREHRIMQIALEKLTDKLTLLGLQIGSD